MGFFRAGKSFRWAHLESGSMETAAGKTRALASGAGGIGDAGYLAVDIFAEVVPDFLRHFQKYTDDFGIELPAGPLLDLGLCGVKRVLRSIRAILHECVERIRDGKEGR